MDTDRRPADDLLQVARALLLLQGAILVATTIEALIWGAIFGASASVALSGLSALAILVARARLRPDRRRSRRIVHLVEGVTIVFFVIDSALAIALTHALPPVVTILTQLVLPVSVITLLRRSARAAAGRIPSNVVAAFGGMS
jgi:hypothetical protein